MDSATLRAAYKSQCGEITEHHIYANLSKKAVGKNRAVLDKISKEELGHYHFWRRVTKREARPSKILIFWYTLLANLLGFTFSLRLMESGEQNAQEKYAKFRGVPGIQGIIRDEKEHESKLISMIDDERLDYTGSIVLGLNDALVELTGALAGMTLAIQNAKIVAIAGLVTGLAASLSMAASNYLASKEDPVHKRTPFKSATYTGLTYLLVVLILISPYFLLGNLYASLAMTLSFAIIIIAAYTFYITTAKMTKFWPQFLEMAIISLSTAGISFVFGLLLNQWLGI